MMFYVIGSEEQSRVLLHTAPANRTKGVVEQCGTFGVPIPCRTNPTNYVSIWWNISIQLLCSGVPLCHYYTDNVLCRQGCKTLSLYSEFQKEISTVAEKFSLPVRTFSREISTGKKNSVQPGQNFQNPLPTKLVGSLNPNFCPNWPEVEKLTSTQVVSKLKITSTQLAEKSGCSFYSDCVEVKFASKQKARH